ncbi:Protein kinase of the Mitotic Exit Network [Microbotryomycetes sp. JL221]|nr:Protein kinase of the Mitotic Exit Network [Microbotryomycetes sp. JL221]
MTTGVKSEGDPGVTDAILMSGADMSDHVLHNYKLGEKLGQGSFGQVYRALNWLTGETCAIKQVTLTNIRKQDLPEIMSEIDLLKKLDHPNIVQYRGSVKTPQYLYIVLEFCENGSLQTITKKFGHFPESLVALYTLQVLQGLAYLHDQGVIHRDIKASNILATKDGSIKLADFGVATVTDGPLDSRIVGSPYWMAPEVVEQNGATTASDVWSVGALVIELLSGRPPYYFLDPMPALFKIVNDDCPPIPDGASAAARDFLTLCFQKDANLRVSARKLLRHPWIMAAKQRADATKKEQQDKLTPVISHVARDKNQLNVLDHNEPMHAFARSKEADEATLRSNSRRKSVVGHDETATVNAQTRVERHRSLTMRGQTLVNRAESEGNLAGLASASDGARIDSDPERTIKAPKPRHRPDLPVNMSPITEDYSDLAANEEMDSFRDKVLDLKSLERRSSRASHLAIVTESPRRLPPRSQSMQSLSLVPSTPKTPSAAQEQYGETNLEDYSEVLGQVTNGSSLRALSRRLTSGSRVINDETDEDDPFIDIEEASAVYDIPNSERAETGRLASRVVRLTEMMHAQASEVGIQNAAYELIGVLEEHSSMHDRFIKSHGLFALMEVLQTVRNRDVLGVLLRIVNVSRDALERFCLGGGCPTIAEFASSRYSREIRLEAALFIGSMCRTSPLTLQTFVSCRGLRTLVELMDENYHERKDLVWMAVDGMSRVFEMQGPTARTDLSRIFIQDGLLPPLSSALLSVAADEDDLAESAKAKIVEILHLFSQSDAKIKEKIASRPIVLKLIKAIPLLNDGLLVQLVKTIKNLSMTPAALDGLQNADGIAALVRLLDRVQRGSLTTDVQSHAISALFNLCRLSKSRLEEAASVGAIRPLQAIARANTPLKQFALPILCDFAHAGKVCRQLLRQERGLQFYLELLGDSFWATPALEAILAWLIDDTAEVERQLATQRAIECLLQAFCFASTSTFEAMVEPYYKIMRLSSLVTIALATQPSFLQRLDDKLSKGGRAVSDPALLVRELAKEVKKEFCGLRGTWIDPSDLSTVTKPSNEASRRRSGLRRTTSDGAVAAMTPPTTSVLQEASTTSQTAVPSRRQSMLVGTRATSDPTRVARLLPRNRSGLNLPFFS